MQDFFYTLLATVGASPSLCQPYWQELTAAYTEPHRAYHTLSHIHHLIGQLQTVESLMQDPATGYLAAFYHDCIYDPARIDNEIQSAQLAQQRLAKAGIPEETVQQVIGLIEATQHHEANEIPDSALFLDADLSILGAALDPYQRYAAQIRTEYSQYPDAAYQAGRVQVLQSFLSKASIFQTVVFRDRYEVVARHNLQWELQELTGTRAD